MTPGCLLAKVDRFSGSCETIKRREERYPASDGCYVGLSKYKCVGGDRMNEHPVIALIRGKLTNPCRPFTLIADLEAQPGRGDEVEAAIAVSQAVALTRAEQGCLEYNLCRDADAPDQFVAYESWRDLDALREHLAAPHFAAVGAALGGLLAAAPAIRVLISVHRLRDPEPGTAADGGGS
jgi:quinol monooxygenase YgiN